MSLENKNCEVCGVPYGPSRLLHWANGDGTGEIVCTYCASALPTVRTLKAAVIKLERDVRDAGAGLSKDSTRPHSHPDECPTYYDGCNCTVYNLNGMMEDLEKAWIKAKEMAAAAETDKAAVKAAWEQLDRCYQEARRAPKAMLGNFPAQAVRFAMDDYDEVKADRDEIQGVFDRMHDADMRGIKLWQEANPGKDNVWPDKGKMVEWLLTRLDDAESLRKAVEALLDEYMPHDIDGGRWHPSGHARSGWTEVLPKWLAVAGAMTGPTTEPVKAKPSKTPEEYAALVKRVEERFGPEKAWGDLPLLGNQPVPAAPDGWRCTCATIQRNGVAYHTFDCLWPRPKASEVSVDLSAVLRTNTPWPLRDVLRKLIEAADILLNVKSYDGHGHELIIYARDVAKEVVDVLSPSTTIAENRARLTAQGCDFGTDADLKF